MQSKFSLFTELWDDVCRLKNALSNCIDSFTNDDFSAMGVVSVAANEKEWFISVLKAAFRNTVVRFPCPSASLNKRQQQQDSIINTDADIDRYAVMRAYASCHLRLLFDLYVFPEEYLKKSTVKECLLSRFNGEMGRICMEMSGRKEELVSFYNIESDQNSNSNDNSVVVTLDELFRRIDHSNSPSLWKCVLQVRSIMATTVSCEQTFSCLKHSKHTNTKIDNLCKLLIVVSESKTERG